MISSYFSLFYNFSLKQDHDATINNNIFVDCKDVIMRSLMFLLDEEKRRLSTNLNLSFRPHFNDSKSGKFPTPPPTYQRTCTNVDFQVKMEHIYHALLA
jgi:hypothetical protein